MKSKRYIGPVAYLKNKLALVREQAGRTTAQFNDTTLTRTVDNKEVMLGFGWHEFAASDFEDIG